MGTSFIQTQSNVLIYFCSGSQYGLTVPRRELGNLGSAQLTPLIAGRRDSGDEIKVIKKKMRHKNQKEDRKEVEKQEMKGKD